MSAILHRNLVTQLPTVVRGEGAYLYDQSGKRYLDACGGAAVSALGHSNATVIQAIKDQLDKVAYAHTSFFTNEPAEELAELLVARAPQGFGAGRVMYLGSGSEAMEAALKLARQYHVERGDVDRGYIIGREMAYHGNTLGALSGRRPPSTPCSLSATLDRCGPDPCLLCLSHEAGGRDRGRVWPAHREPT